MKTTDQIRNEAVRDVLRCADAKRQEYRSDKSVDLNLTENEAISLSLALKDALSTLLHVAEPASWSVQEIVAGAGIFDPTSHIGTLVTLLRRIDHVRHGRKLWNQGR